jgi:hypothetical protein
VCVLIDALFIVLYLRGMSENQIQKSAAHRNARRERRRDARCVVHGCQRRELVGGGGGILGDRRAGTFRQKRFADAGRRADAAGAAGNYKLFGNDAKNFGERRNWPTDCAWGLFFKADTCFNQLTIAENVALPLQYQKNLTPDEAAPEVKNCSN